MGSFNKPQWLKMQLRVEKKKFFFSGVDRDMYGVRTQRLLRPVAASHEDAALCRDALLKIPNPVSCEP